MQEHFQKTESVPKDFVTVEGVTSKLENDWRTAPQIPYKIVIHDAAKG